MCEIVKFDVNNPISLEYSTDIKEELKDEYYPDNKVCVSEVTVTNTINISNTELNGHTKNEQISKYETLFLDNIKIDMPTPEANDTIINNVKIDGGICSADRQTEFCNELLFCNHCHEVYQDYCTKCRVLIYILNRTTNNRIRGLPKDMLEARESIGHLGIFSLKVIPENVRFGPFTGLNSTGLPLRIKGGRFVISDDKSEHMNWMQYINPARNIYEQNLLPFQYDDKLYYCSTHRIQEGEELLVYFGEEYQDNLLKDIEMDFVPIAKEDVENVFACIFCCLGFSSKEYLAEHKAASHSGTNEMFSIEELTQCPFCKIYLEAKEYFEHHMDYCCETNDRYYVHPAPVVHKLEVQKRSSKRREVKKWKRGIYKCTQCKFRTISSADFRHHSNEHCRIKMYICVICHRRYKARDLLKAHVEENHGSGIQKNITCDYFKEIIKNMTQRSPHVHNSNEQSQCKKGQYYTKGICRLKSLIKIKYLSRGKYKCANCEFKTYYRSNLDKHIKAKHLKQNNYKCTECEFKTNYKSSLECHIRAKHLKIQQNHYKCIDCEFKTNYKSCLKVHIKSQHLKEHDYKCTECEFKTYYKSSLEAHRKAKHLKQNVYKCVECEFKTNIKGELGKHIKRKHLKQNDYKCTECEFKTSYKSSLEVHIEAKHLENVYQCTECEFKTNYKAHLKVHIKAIHLKETDYKCTECEFKTIYKAHLERHVKEIHLKQHDYGCTECEYKTNYKSRLESHIKAKHLKQKDYKCIKCEFKTNYKSGLQIHIKGKHLKQNDYKCVECEFRTYYKSTLVKHIKAKHLKQNHHKCMECEYMTSSKSDLESHINGKHLKQKNYECTECEYKTHNKLYLEGHIKRKHHNENEYKCMECEFKTNYKGNVERHIKAKHLQKNDYKCVGCEFKTNIKSHLKKHMERKHLKQK